VHLREDRRHIQERDLRVLRQTVTTRLNLEMACDDAIVALAREVRPDEATLVPERREELTTEGGLDVVAHQKTVARAMERLAAAGIEAAEAGEGRLSVTAPPERVGDLAAEAGIPLHELVAEGGTLEEAFLELTEGTRA
jgi:pyridoxine 5-phosphate synthase